VAAVHAIKPYSRFPVLAPCRSTRPRRRRAPRAVTIRGAGPKSIVNTTLERATVRFAKCRHVDARPVGVLASAPDQAGRDKEQEANEGRRRARDHRTPTTRRDGH